MVNAECINVILLLDKHYEIFYLLYKKKNTYISIRSNDQINQLWRFEGKPRVFTDFFMFCD